VSGLVKPTHPFKAIREIENIVLLSRDLATHAPIWYSRPTEIEFSFNNLCNLKCIMCGKADEKIRAGAHYATAADNIKNTLKRAAEDDTEITFHLALMRLNLHQLPDYIRFVAELGGAQIKVQELLPNSRL
jgi:MoaA/NifB/PqqE/SkfB family radical SAM enzyme